MICWKIIKRNMHINAIFEKPLENTWKTFGKPLCKQKRWIKTVWLLTWMQWKPKSPKKVCKVGKNIHIRFLWWIFVCGSSEPSPCYNYNTLPTIVIWWFGQNSTIQLKPKICVIPLHQILILTFYCPFQFQSRCSSALWFWNL